jgi:hypothetical protein
MLSAIFVTITAILKAAFLAPAESVAIKAELE